MSFYSIPSIQQSLFHTDDDHFVGQFSGRGTGAAGGDEGGDGVQADPWNTQDMPAVALLRRMLSEPQGRGSAGHEDHADVFHNRLALGIWQHAGQSDGAGAIERLGR